MTFIDNFVPKKNKSFVKCYFIHKLLSTWGVSKIFVKKLMLFFSARMH